MDSRWKSAGAEVGNGCLGDVTGTLGGMMGGKGNTRTLGVNTRCGRGVDCARRRFLSERVTKSTDWSDWTVANGVAGLGCCKACTRFCAVAMAASADKVVGMGK